MKARGDVMADDQIRFRLSLNDEQGNPAKVQFGIEGAQSVILQLLSSAASIPQPQAIAVEVTTNKSAGKATAFGIFAPEDDPTQADVVVSFGPLQLAFSVSVDLLLRSLESLQEAIEPNSRSLHRPN